MSGSTVSPEPTEAGAVVIGGSAGAIEVLLTLLSALPRHYPWPVLVVVHLPPTEKSLLPEIFAARCALPVKEAEDKEPIRPGQIYFAPPDYHLLVESDFSLSLSSEEPVLYSRPSIDVLFETAADAYGTGLVAVVVTGASSDGAAGLRTVHARGGRTFVQLPATAEAPLMPQLALEACPQARSLAVAELGQTLASLPTPPAP